MIKTVELDLPPLLNLFAGNCSHAANKTNKSNGPLLDSIEQRTHTLSKQ